MNDTVLPAESVSSLAGRMPLPLRPLRFREPVRLHAAFITGRAPSFADRGHMVRGARAMGIRYEKRIQQELLARYNEYYIPSPWFRFYDAYGQRWCQPDGLFVDIPGGIIIIVEMKHHHTGEAWWKLHKLYLPVVRKVFGPNWKYYCLEIVRWYDSSELFPYAKLCEIPHIPPPLPFTGVHIMKPRANEKESA